MIDQVPKWLEDLAPRAGERWSKGASRAGLERARELHRQKRDLIDRVWSTRQALVKISAEHADLGELEAEESAAARWLEHYSIWVEALEANIRAHEEEGKAARVAMTDRPHEHQFKQVWRDQLYSGEECTICVARRIVSSYAPDVEQNPSGIAHQRWLRGGLAPGDVSNVRSTPLGGTRIIT